MADDELKNQVEAIIFSCGRKIDIEEISKLLPGLSEMAIKDAIKDLKKEYDEKDSGIVLLEEGEGWKMAVREKYLTVVRKITPYMEFPKTVMETLAVIAWKQPILQSDVIRIRTNKAYDHIVELEKMGFLAKEKHGRSFLLKLSQKFYDYFDLRDDADLRKLFRDIKDDEPAQKKVREFGDAERDVAGKEAGSGNEDALGKDAGDFEDADEPGAGREPASDNQGIDIGDIDDLTTPEVVDQISGLDEETLSEEIELEKDIGEKALEETPALSDKDSVLASGKKPKKHDDIKKE